MPENWTDIDYDTGVVTAMRDGKVSRFKSAIPLETLHLIRDMRRQNLRIEQMREPYDPPKDYPIHFWILFGLFAIFITALLGFGFYAKTAHSADCYSWQALTCPTKVKHESTTENLLRTRDSRRAIISTPTARWRTYDEDGDLRDNLRVEGLPERYWPIRRR